MKKWRRSPHPEGEGGTLPGLLPGDGVPLLVVGVAVGGGPISLLVRRRLHLDHPGARLVEDDGEAPAIAGDPPPCRPPAFRAFPGFGRRRPGGGGERSGVAPTVATVLRLRCGGGAGEVHPGDGGYRQDGPGVDGGGDGHEDGKPLRQAVAPQPTAMAQ